MEDPEKDSQNEQNYLKNLITVGQNVLEQEPVDKHITSLKNQFNLLNSTDSEVKSTAYGNLFTVLVNYGEFLLRQDVSKKLSTIPIPALIKLVSMGETSWEKRVFAASNVLLEQNLWNQSIKFIKSGEYLSALISKEIIFSNNNKGFIVGKVIEAHRNLLFGIGDITFGQNPLLALYAYSCKQEVGKTLTNRGILRPTAFEEGSYRWQVKSFPAWSEQILSEAKDYPARGIMFGADDLGFARDFSSGTGSVKDYFRKRGIIKDGE